MRTIWRCLGAWLAALLLLTAMLLGLAGLVMTETWAGKALCAPELAAAQQARIDRDAAALAKRYGMDEAALQPYSADAAAQYGNILALWWGELFRSEDADGALPAWLDFAQERALVEAVMADPAFTPSDVNLRRQEARDVAYELDALVRRTVLPLRPAVTELSLALLTRQVSLTQLRQAALIGACAALALALLLVMLVRKAAGSILAGTGAAMAALSIPVMLLNVHEMMLQLSPDAAQQADRLLLWLGIPWYGAALAMTLAGLLILKIKDVRR